MKVMLIGTDATMSGAGLSMIALADNLKTLGVEVVIIVKAGNTEKILSEKGIGHYIVNCQSWMYSEGTSKLKRNVVGYIKRLINIPAYFQYVHLIKRENPDLVHINTGTSGCAGMAAIKCGKKIVWHIREMMEEDLGSSFAQSGFSKKILARANAIICISNAVYIKFHSMIPSVSMYKIYNGIELADYHSVEKVVFVQNKTIFTIAGRINANKGQYETIKSIKDILINNNCELWIVGDGEEKEIHRIQEYIKNNNIPNDRVLFWGRVRNMSEIWDKTDIAIVASKYEAFGRVTVESMARGCLVIGANTGGTAELISDGSTGLLYRQGDCDSLKEKVYYAINHKEEMKKIARAGRQRVCSEFTAKQNAEKVMLVYKTVLSRK